MICNLENTKKGKLSNYLLNPYMKSTILASDISKFKTIRNMLTNIDNPDTTIFLKFKNYYFQKHSVIAFLETFSWVPVADQDFWDLIDFLETYF